MVDAKQRLMEINFYRRNSCESKFTLFSIKTSADLLVKAYYETYHFPMNITRCSNNYGQFQHEEKLIPLMIKSALSGKELPVYGDGMNVRDWLYIEDHCKAIDMVLSSGREGKFII